MEARDGVCESLGVIGDGGSNPGMGELQEQRPTGSEEEDGLLFVRMSWKMDQTRL